MCYDPWEHGVRNYVSLYSQAVFESTRKDRDEQYRHIWSGKAESFAKGYPDKLAELDDEDLEEWIDEVSDFTKESKELYLPAAEEEQKRRAKDV